MKTNLEIAEEALAKWPTSTMGILRTGIRDDLLLPAIADARADGYAEAKGDIARGLRNLADGFHFAGDLPAEKTLRNWIDVTLAPATTKEPT